MVYIVYWVQTPSSTSISYNNSIIKCEETLQYFINGQVIEPEESLQVSFRFILFLTDITPEDMSPVVTYRPDPGTTPFIPCPERTL